MAPVADFGVSKRVAEAVSNCKRALGPTLGRKLAPGEVRVPFSVYEIPGPAATTYLDKRGRVLVGLPRLKKLSRVVDRADVERLRAQGRLPLWRDNP